MYDEQFQAGSIHLEHVLSKEFLPVCLFGNPRPDRKTHNLNLCDMLLQASVLKATAAEFVPLRRKLTLLQRGLGEDDAVDDVLHPGAVAKVTHMCRVFCKLGHAIILNATVHMHIVQAKRTQYLAMVLANVVAQML